MTDDPTWLCYRGDQCADVRKRTIEHDDGSIERQYLPARAVAAGLLCRTDTTIVRAAIEQLPMDYVELRTLLRKSSTTDGPISGTRELPVPIRLGVSVLADTILDEAERWAEVLAASCGFWFAPCGTRSDRLSRATGWLAGLYDRLLRLPATEHARIDATDHHADGRDATRYTTETGSDGALQLLALHEHTTLLAGRTRRAERLQAPCEECHRLALEHDEGASHVECRRCGARMSLTHYEEHCAGALADAYEAHPRGRPERDDERPVRIAAGPPIWWADGTVHDRVDAGSNMMLRYLERHDARQVA